MEESNYHQGKFSFLMRLALNPEKFEKVRRILSGNSSLENKFSAVWKLEELHNYFTPTLIESGKSEDEAIRLRNEGNACFRENKFLKALQLYNSSIMNAPHPILSKTSLVQNQDASPCKEDCFAIPQINPCKYGGTTGEHTALAMAYANRAALMLELGLYMKCLNDIELALNHGYPKDRCEKLQNRKEKCLAALKRKKTFADGAVKMPQLYSPEDSAEQYGFDPKALLDMMQCHFVCKVPTLKEVISLPKMKLRRKFTPNPKVPSISSALRIDHFPSKGRGLVAVRDIQPGEVVGIERGYYAALEEEKLSFFCSVCMQLSMTPLPCPSCCKVIFCSESCREKGLAEEHWIECKILTTVSKLQLDVTGSSYKLLKTFTYQQVDAILDKSSKQKTVNPEKLGCNEEGVYDSTSYQTVMNLSSNEQHYPFESILNFTLTSVILTKLLILSGRYFVNSKGEPITPKERDLLQTGVVLISNAMKTIANDIAVKTTKDDIGSCLYPAFSLINHACDPSISYVQNGRELLFRAIRPISAGQEVTVAYCKRYSQEEKPERTLHLNNFYFNCDCEACGNDWPTFRRQPHFRAKCSVCVKDILVEGTFICQSCTTQCSDFQKQENIRKVVKFSKYVDTFKKISKNVTLNQPVTRDDFRELCKMNEFIHKNLTRPCLVFPSLHGIMERFFQGGF